MTQNEHSTPPRTNCDTQYEEETAFLNWAMTKERRVRPRYNAVPLSARYTRGDDTDSDDDVQLNTNTKGDLEELATQTDTNTFQTIKDIVTPIIVRQLGQRVLAISISAQVVSLVTSTISNWRNRTWNTFVKLHLFSGILGVLTTIASGFNYELREEEVNDLLDFTLDVTDDSGEKKGHELHREVLNSKMGSRSAILEYISKHRLTNSFRLPICTFGALTEKENSWVWETYSNSFIAAWYDQPDFEVSSRRPLKLERQGKNAIIKTLLEVAQRAISIFFFWVQKKFTGESFNRGDLKDGIIIGNAISGCTGNLINDLVKHFDEGTEVLRQQVEEYVSYFNAFLETPNFEFSGNLRYLYETREKIDEAQRFVRGAGRDKAELLFPLQSLLTAAAKRKNEILSSVLPEFKRQEPFVVLLCGKGAIGKTYYIQELARKLVRDLFPDTRGMSDYIEIRNDDKYWPPLSGQRVAFFDEAGTVADLRTDLLFNNIKALCSPAYFNCPAADVEHKITPCPFQIILATTNTPFDQIQQKYASTHGRDSVYPMWRRVIPVEVTWNTKSAGVLDLNYPAGHKSDYSHLRFTKMMWDAPSNRLKPERELDAAGIETLIRERYSKNLAAHQRSINLQFAQKQTEHRMHYSIHLHGKPGHGKTPSALKLLSQLALTFGMDKHIITTLDQAETLSLRDRPCVFLFDDVFDAKTDPKTQQRFMNLYNTRIPNNSILIFCSNISTGYHFVPKFNFTHYHFRRTHKFEVTGVMRRLGFTGNFLGIDELPGYNSEFYCRNGTFFQCATKEFHITTLLPLLGFLIAPLLSWYLLLPVIAYYFWTFRQLHCRTPIESLDAECYEGYRKFMSIRQEVVVQLVPELPSIEFNFDLRVPKPENFKLPENALELDKHVTLNREVFANTRHHWMMYFDRELADKLRCVYHRFFINDSVLNDTVVLRELTRCARAILEYGIRPRMRIEVSGVGRYAFDDGKIYKEERNSEKQAEVIIHTTPVGIILLSDRKQLEITVTEIFGTVNVPLKHKLSLLEALEYANYTTSLDFLNTPHIRQYLVQKQKEDLDNHLKLRFKELRDRYTAFSQTPAGRFANCVYLILFALLTGTILWKTIRGIINMCSGTDTRRQDRGKGARKRNPKYYSDVDTRQDNGKGKRKKNEHYYSDDERPRQDKGKGKRKNNPALYSDDEHEKPPKARQLVDLIKQAYERQDVKTLVDMNDFDGYKTYIDNAYTKVKRGMCMIYVVCERERVLCEEPAGTQSCYGLFVRGRTLVTVGHLKQQATGWYNCYVGCDSFNGKFYRCRLLKSYRTRDISFWEVEDNTLPSFPDITNLFLSRKELYSCDNLNTTLQRYGTDKTEHWIQGSCEIIEEFHALDEDGISEFGYIDFTTMGIQLTYYGDCGLPYYIIERERFHDKLIGIHCMGNVEGYSSIGVVAILVKEDFQDLAYQTIEDKFSTPDVESCTFCATKEAVLAPSKNPKCKLHEIVWGATHESSTQTFVEELRKFCEVRNNFQGLIIKNSGPQMFGSVPHSHTQFLTGEFDKDIDKPTNGWRNATAGELGFSCERFDRDDTFTYRILQIQFSGLYTVLKNLGYARNYRLAANVFVLREKRCALVRIVVPISERQLLLERPPTYSRQATLPLTLIEGQVVHVPGDILDVFTQHTRRYNQRGMLPDVAYERVTDNETVTVLGVASRNMSPAPSNAYFPTPFHHAIGSKCGVYKVPVRYDAENAPQAQKDVLACDRLGNPSGLITGALGWAHKDFSPPVELRRYARREYLANILSYYANLNILTDEQLFKGYAIGHRLRGGLSPLEVDTSIGWTLKQLFNVTKKNDVLHLDELGNYSWKDNEASEYTQELFALSCEQSKFGERYWTVFLELMKMEKLKPEKEFCPRTFTANDLIGVLMERRILGEFTARAMLWDETVAVGMNALTDFDKLYRRLAKHKNQFTIDYKKFDRTIPASVFEDLRDNLILANPHLENELNSCFSTLIMRVQVAGTTVSLVRGGMPSGCIPTAPLNSKCNDYIIFSAYVAICWDEDRSEIATYSMYDKYVVRIYYGDDAWIGVDDEISDFFHCVSVAEKVKQIFGMNITPGSKNGNPTPFESTQDISFISRFPRRLEELPFVVGALKKISIVTHLHWTTSVTPEQMGSQLMLAQLEAALWDDEFFTTFQECVRIAIRIEPGLARHFAFRTRLALQKEVFDGAYANNLIFQDTTGALEFKESLVVAEQLHQTRGELTRTERTNAIRSTLRRFTAITPGQYERFFRRVLKNEKQLDFARMSLYCVINELFQKGAISKPRVTYTRCADGSWKCLLEITANPEVLCASAISSSKLAARELACGKILKALYPIVDDLDEREDTSKILEQYHARIYKCECEEGTLPPFPRMVRQMNVSRGVEHQTPGAPLTNLDPSVTPDSGIVTNTFTPSPSRVINPGAISLDNPAGTGAAFDKRDAVYGIYARWASKSTTVNGSLAEGSEILRISLDPATWPQRIREYVDFHQYILPQIDVQIVIGGAAGTIGWLKIGWVPDDKRQYGLDDIQTVASETVNLNGTITMSTLLSDNRQYGMFRKVKGDSEPWPALIMMVEHPALNVQRNDDVGYPIRVNVRLGPGCALMYPLNNITKGETSVGEKITLQRYLKTSAVDFLIGNNLLVQRTLETYSYPSCGYNTGSFRPTFTFDNFAGCRFSDAPVLILYTSKSEISVPTKEYTFDVELKRTYFPEMVFFAYGRVPKVLHQMVNIRYSPDKPLFYTTYAIPKFTIAVSNCSYSATNAMVFEEGIAFSFTLDDYSFGQAAITYDYNSRKSTLKVTSLSKPERSQVILLTKRNDTPSAFFAQVAGDVDFCATLDLDKTNPSVGAHLASFPTSDKGILPGSFGYLSIPSPTNRLYTFTYNQTGNTLPSDNLPSGLAGLFVVRPGTTSSATASGAFAAIQAPGMHDIYPLLNDILKRTGSLALTMTLYVGNDPFAKIGYIEGAFVARTSANRLIRTGLRTDLSIGEITPTDSISGLQAFPTLNFTSWGARSTGFRSRNFDVPLVRQSAFAALGMAGQAVGSLYTTIGQGLMYWDYKNWADQRQKTQNDLLLKLQDMKNLSASQVEEIRARARIDAQKQQFEQQLALTGYSSASAQSGNLNGRAGFGYRNGGNYGNFVSAGTWDPGAHLKLKGATTDETSTDIDADTEKAGGIILGRDDNSTNALASTSETGTPKFTTFGKSKEPEPYFLPGNDPVTPVEPTTQGSAKSSTPAPEVLGTFGKSSSQAGPYFLPATETSAVTPKFAPNPQRDMEATRSLKTADLRRFDIYSTNQPLSSFGKS